MHSELSWVMSTDLAATGFGTSVSPRKVVSVTGSRADYGLMAPVYSAIAQTPELELHLIVTGMQLLPEFKYGLECVKADGFGRLHFIDMELGGPGGAAMAHSLGLAIERMSPLLEAVSPDVVLIQGDRGEMLATAVVAAHMNIPVVHMSGGDRTGTIDDPIRSAISAFAHMHLTTCSKSSERLRAIGEPETRILEVGEPGLDAIRMLDPIEPVLLAAELELDLRKPVVIGAFHPVTTEALDAGIQMTGLLEALLALDLQAVITYPNSDAGGVDMREVLESYRGRDRLRILPNLGSRKFLSLMSLAALIVGNSSSGIIEAPSFRLPAVNIGTRQHGRLRSTNVIDVGYSTEEIAAGIRRALEDNTFRERLARCQNPYGDGNTAGRTVEILKRLRITPGLIAKWIHTDEVFVK
jgi:UDP-N-acetylglucosamine 2-epimerase (non-hydrolysing)/GDP/UDP-N,N'-diacetylbacillosamine 2-epimerase (hydrolysing)